MGLITIEVPQRVTKTYQIASEKKAKELIDNLDKMKQKKGKIRDLSDVFGIWADRPESAEEIARKLRKSSNQRKEQKKDDLNSALDAVIGMWSYRKESTEEIAERLRAGWNRKNGKQSG